MIHPDFKLIEEDQGSRQTGPLLLNPSTREIVTALQNPPAILLREPMDLTDPMGEDVYLQTSGTTGKPKLLGHSLAKLQGRIRPVSPDVPGAAETWLLTYEPASFAGLQVILTAVARGTTLVIGGVEEAIKHKVTHISGTATFWRVFLSALGKRSLNLQAITLGGERADQSILDALAKKFPKAHLTHIYASTEAGAVFSVTDGKEGFPADWLNNAPHGVLLRINDEDVLEVQSPRAASEEWIVTGDLVEQKGDRILFNGRIDDMINIGGVKVRPTMIEDMAMTLKGIEDVACYGKANPITGEIVALEVMPTPGQDEAALRTELKSLFADLDRTAQPRSIKFVDQIKTGTGNKKIRKPG